MEMINQDPHQGIRLTSVLNKKSCYFLIDLNNNT